MAVKPAMKGDTPVPGVPELLSAYLEYLRLPYIREHYEALAKEAAELGWSHVQYLERLIEGEAHLREDRRIQRRIRLARFAVVKTLDQFN